MSIALEMAVRVKRPPKTSLGDFFADMRAWLDHQSIEPAEFRRTAADSRGEFEVRFNRLGRREPFRTAVRRQGGFPKNIR